MLPPIRYPLPTLVALGLASLLTWHGLEWSKEWRASVASRARLAIEGPPVPSSSRPRGFAGPVMSRALLLLDETPTSDRPNGHVVETIDRRMFVDVYDTWPEPGPTSHVRVGNRKPIGWVPVANVLPWDTRLVIRTLGNSWNLARSPDGTSEQVEVGSGSLPVLGWTDRAVEVGVWDRAHPWSKLARRGWIPSTEIPAESWGVWISQVELPILLGMANDGESPLEARLRAVFGRLADNRTWSPVEVETLGKALPPIILARKPDASRAAGPLAEFNARPSPEARWSGLNFQFLTLDRLP